MRQRRSVSLQDIKTEVLARIRKGIWRAGSAAAAEEALARELGCARPEVDRALQELTADGFLAGADAPVKQARFDVTTVRAEIEASGATYDYMLRHRAEIDTPAWLCEVFGLPASARTLHLRAVHLADAQAFQMEERWIHVPNVPHVLAADFTQDGPHEWLIAEVPEIEADLAFSAVGADATLSNAFSVAPRTPLLRVNRTVWQDGAPVTHARLTYHPGYEMRTQY